MRTSKAVVAAVVALCALGACNKGNEKTTADTTTVPRVDTTKGMARPTTDTVVKTTTTKTDTLKGSAKAGTKTKTKAGTKTKTKTKAGYKTKE